MRRGTRRGQTVADGLRVVVRGDDKDTTSPLSSPDSPDSPDTPHHTTFTSSSTTKSSTTASSAAKTKSILPAASNLTLPLPAATSAAATTLSTTSLFLNHPELSSTTSTTSSSSFQPTTTNPPPTSTVPIYSKDESSTRTRSPIVSNAPTSSIPAGRQVMDGSKETASVTADFDSTPSDGLGQPSYPYDGHPHLGAGAVAGIAVGSSLGTLLIAALLFLLWRKWNKRDKKSSNQEPKDNSGAGAPAPSVRQYLPRRFTHKSDDRIMNELMTAAYSAENGGRSSYMDQMPINGNGYMEEKMQRYEEDDEIPIMLPEPEPVAPRFKRTKRISRWLGRHESQMLNPNLARASFVSNATGLQSLDLRSMSGWGSEDGYSEYSRYTEPPTTLQPAPRREDAERRQPQIQGVDIRVRDSTPITQFPSPEELKLPPPPVRPPSVAARTEVTGRSSGTWNTWGVMQHRDQPKGWKDKLGM